jgi:hypothetical protein
VRKGVSLAGLAAVVVVGAIAASSYQACSVYDASLLVGPDSSAVVAPEASGDANGDGGCVGAVPPSRPAPTPDDDAASQITVVAAFNTIDIGLTELDASVPPFGYNLDEQCTCPGPPSCAQQAKAPETCDDPDSGGRDNSDIKLFRLFGMTATSGTMQIDQQLSMGQYGLLLVVNNYNGQPDDSNVTVDFYVSDGLARDDAGLIPRPKLDGQDMWTRDVNSISPSNTALYSDDTAYVSNSVVVAHFGKIPITFGDRSFLGGATMKLSSAVIVGQLTAYSEGDSGSAPFGFALKGGTIAGRWSTTDLLSTLATIPDTTSDASTGGFLCGDSGAYQIIKIVVCQTADISSNVTNDNNTPLAPCDAISVGLQFTALPAQLGPVIAVPPAPAGCADSNGTFTDKCSQ